MKDIQVSSNWNASEHH